MTDNIKVLTDVLRRISEQRRGDECGVLCEEAADAIETLASEVERLTSDVDALGDNLKAASTKTCNWVRDCTEDGDCHWETACGTGWCTTWNTPAEDNYNFCPSCGGKVAHVRNDETKEN